MPLSTITVTGTWRTPSNTAPTGSVTIVPVGVATGGGQIVAGVPVTVQLSAGSITTTVVSNAEATSLQYRVTEYITGAPSVSYVVTPAGATLDLSTAPRSASGTAALYVLASTVGQASGVASLGADGKVPAAQLPAASGGGVNTVTAADGTIVVGGTATAPTVRVGSIAQSQVANLTTDLASKTPTSRQITAGTGLTGGGDLTADRTLAVSYGTTAGTAAQGNDSRITGAIQTSTATAKGDLLAATGSATITRLGIGTDGQVLTADSTQPAGVKWAEGTAGSSSITLTVRTAYITSGDVLLPNTGSSWAVLTGFQLSIPASVGDYVELGVHGMRSATTSAFVDIAVITGATPTIRRYLATGTASPAIEGDPGWYPQATTFVRQSGSRGLTVASGDLDGTNLRFAVVVKAAGSGTLYASSNYPFYWRAMNYGPVS